MLINCDAEHRNLSSRGRKSTVNIQHEEKVAERRHLSFNISWLRHSIIGNISIPWTYAHGY